MSKSIARRCAAHYQPATTADVADGVYVRDAAELNLPAGPHDLRWLVYESIGGMTFFVCACNSAERAEQVKAALLATRRVRLNVASVTESGALEAPIDAATWGLLLAAR